MLLYDSFCTFEISPVLEILALSGKPITVFGISKQAIRSEDGLSVVPDETIESIDIEAYDSLILPGAMDIRKSIENEDILAFIKKFDGKIIGAISIAPLLLVKAGLLEGKPFMAGVNKEELLEEGFAKNELAQMVEWDENLSNPIKDGYIIAGNIITSMAEKGIDAQSDLTFSLYLPRREDFHKRVKLDFPAAAVSLQDYNALRRMLGHPPITLDDGEFATQWQTIATPEERAEHLCTHTKLETDAGVLNLASQPAYTEPMGETIYNSYTDVLYILPDAVCQQLLPVMRNRYICTADPISFRSAQEMGKLFSNIYPEENADGPSYTIRMRTLQVNENKASNFILKTAMVYGAFVLMVICLTVLALQQLMDAEQYQARFLVLQRLGAEEGEIRKLILRLLGIWFGLPVSIAAVISMVVGGYFLQSISAEIRAYIGSDVLAAQCTTTVGILILLLGCYFICTYLLFQRSVEKR